MRHREYYQLMDFQTDKIKNLKINGTPYSLHVCALKKASIFESLNDVSEGDPNIIIPNATSPDLAKIIKLLYGLNINDIFIKTPVKNIVNIVSIMMHMGINLEDIKKCITKMLDHTVDIVNDIISLESYSDSAKLIMEMHEYNKEYSDNFDNLIDMIKKSSFPDSFKIEFINKIICRSLKFENYDFVTGINSNYLFPMYNPDMRYVLDIFHCSIDKDKSSKNWSSEPKKIFLKYLKIEPKCNLIYHPTELKISRIEINDKIIELVQYNKTFTKGTTGSNTLMSISTYIAKVLLGIEIL